MRLPVLLSACYLILFQPLRAQEATEKEAAIPQKTYATQRAGQSPVIDGLLHDEAWEQVEWTGNFTQIQPDKGAAPTQQTAFKVLYDAKNLYVAIRAFDTEPQKIEKRMSRRDGFAGD
jgi:hypothetical protein